MIQLQDVRVALDAEAGLVRALDGLSLTLHRGQTFALVGESGCGKSMTALALMRLLPDSGMVTGGRILMQPEGGQGADAVPIDLLRMPECDMRRVRGGDIGIIFQEPATSLNPVMRVGEQIIESIETHTPLRGAKAREKAIDWLRRVGIPEPERRIDSYPFEMSGGQKQRVMIAMTLAAEPRFIIADEPTTALDVTIQKQVLDLLRDIQRERQLGLLLITHDLAVVATMAQRVALMYAGQIVEEAPADEFFAAPRHPYARLLLDALPDTRRRGQPLVAIGGTVPPLWLDFEGCRFAPRCPRAQDRCHGEVPALVADAVSPSVDRTVRCWFPVTPRNAAAASVPAEPRTAETVPPHDTTPHAMHPAPLVSVKDLSVTYLSGGGLFRKATEFQAVQGVSYDVHAGRTLALVGESGCGKTTSGRAIVQLMRDDRQIRLGGQVWWNGPQGRQDLFKLDGPALLEARRAIQIVFQDPFASLNPRMRVSAILEEGLQTLRPQWDAGQRRARVLELVDRVGLRQDALQRFPHEFSGGQRQRLAVARALAVEPHVLVCDEPTSALDVSVQAQILNLLRELQSQLGLGLLFITHNMAVVSYLADEVAVMRKGRIVEQGRADQVLGRPEHEYTRHLLSSVLRMPGEG